MQKEVPNKEVNPHMPKFIANAPWYIDENKTGLDH